MSTESSKRQPAGIPVGGQFASHDRAESSTSLRSELPDPWAYMPDFPAGQKRLFTGASTFAEIDAAYIKHAATNPDDLDLRWSALARCREIRKEGAAGTPTALQTEGWGANGFAVAQNYVELAEMFALSTEEPPGDGETPISQVRAWYKRVQTSARERLAELQAAGVAPKSARIG